MSREPDPILDAFRRWGYLQADLDRLGRLPPKPHPGLDVDAPGATRARDLYCGPLAVEFMHIADPVRREWVIERMERPDPGRGPDPDAVLELLVRANVFEALLQSRYIGNKRFSIEGIEALLPLLDGVLRRAAEGGVEQAVIGMSHRGRLNVMAHIVGNDPADLMAGFEDVDPRSIMGAGDVKYHLGATGDFAAGDGRTVRIHLVSNPSHLEAVNPVVLGRAKAKLNRLGDDRGSRVLPILLHGDSAFAGQGITAEILNLAEVPGFAVGGTIHVIVNNLIGFTTGPEAYQSTRFASDLAKRLPIPIFHVNGEEPEAVSRAARIAAAYRQAFASDVVVDLIGYRRHGHSEIDDPTVTQPRLYRKIAEVPPLWQSYAERLGREPAATEELVARVRDELSTAKDKAEKLERIPRLSRLPDYWSGYHGGRLRAEDEVATGLTEDELADLADRITTVPDGFHVHPKVKALLDQRAEMGRGERPVDYGMAELLAYASLVCRGHPVRLSGQDSRRGTFNHRHAVLIDTEDESEYYPLRQVAPDQARFEIYDSVLSEAAVLGFEWGYSRDYPECLVAWEAQFGDFVNGAQVILDQFVTAGEDKWGLLSGLVLLLPHGFEGQGPEHSSARIERFLQLAAEEAIQIAQPSSAAQHFHLLRRQALRKWRKPLVVFTPKSMLRHAAAASELPAFMAGRFLDVRPERLVEAPQRILLCTGKIGHELRAERERRGDGATAVVSLEQLYPFPARELTAEFERLGSPKDVVWVQEEPANMGALSFVMPRLAQVARGAHLRSVKRSPSASPATGSVKAHRIEQKTLVELAFS